MTVKKRCPICRQPIAEDQANERLRPFCSKRCADVDLGRWLNGTYAIPAAATDDESEDGAGDENAGKAEDEADGRVSRTRH